MHEVGPSPGYLGGVVSVFSVVVLVSLLGVVSTFLSMLVVVEPVGVFVVVSVFCSVVAFFSQPITPTPTNRAKAKVMSDFMGHSPETKGRGKRQSLHQVRSRS